MFFNFNCIVLDVCPVRIGAFSLFGPAVQVYTPLHPFNAERRAGKNIRQVLGCRLGSNAGFVKEGVLKHSLALAPGRRPPGASRGLTQNLSHDVGNRLNHAQEELMTDPAKWGNVSSRYEHDRSAACWRSTAAGSGAS